MSKEDHIKELINYLKGNTIVMCPTSRRYWQEHADEVGEALVEAQK